MCGIVGYIGMKFAEHVLLENLEKLEYRGYDSAGIAVLKAREMQVRKAEGKLANLQQVLQSEPCSGYVGIGHTRWATHGKPCEANAHPHTDQDKQFAVVHNGIVENHEALRKELEEKGYKFVSDTDSEVIAHLIADCYKQRRSLTAAVQDAVRMLQGSYALVVLSVHEPDKLIAARQASPLIIGIGEGEQFIGSDIPALLQHTRNVLILEDGELAVVMRHTIEVFDKNGRSIDKDPDYVIWDAERAEKGGYEHFMLKEIHDQPKAYRDTLGSRCRLDADKLVELKELTWTDEMIRSFDRIHLVACGTAYHAALVGAASLEKLLRLPAEACVASEYRYKDPIVNERTLVIAVSQSGETADTLAAVQEAKQKGAHTLAVTNVVGSSLSREAASTLYTWAGPEISVASTKAYTTQLLALWMIAIHMAEVLSSQPRKTLRAFVSEMLQLPEKAERLLAQPEAIQLLAQKWSRQTHMFFIGRGLDYATAMEGSLKLKEISYIHSEAYAAGELKHGTLALVEDGTPVIAIATQPDLLEKTMSNIREVKARGASVIGIITEDQAERMRDFDARLLVPTVHPMLVPALTAIPLQLFAYYASVARGLDVDKPRNLAKSVTVE